MQAFATKEPWKFPKAITWQHRELRPLLHGGRAECVKYFEQHSDLRGTRKGRPELAHLYTYTTHCPNITWASIRGHAQQYLRATMPQCICVLRQQLPAGPVGNRRAQPKSANLTVSSLVLAPLAAAASRPPTKLIKMLAGFTSLCNHPFSCTYVNAWNNADEQWHVTKDESKTCLDGCLSLQPKWFRISQKPSLWKNLFCSPQANALCWGA